MSRSIEELIADWAIKEVKSYWKGDDLEELTS